MMYYNNNRKPLNFEASTKNQFIVLPQWRHYFRRNKENYFNGFHLGASTVYWRDRVDRVENAEKRHLMGLGILVGYQQVIKKKFSIGITPSLHYGLGYSKTNWIDGRTQTSTRTFFIASFDFQIGYIF